MTGIQIDTIVEIFVGASESRLLMDMDSNNTLHAYIHGKKIQHGITPRGEGQLKVGQALNE